MWFWIDFATMAIGPLLFIYFFHNHLSAKFINRSIIIWFLLGGLLVGWLAAIMALICSIVIVVVLVLFLLSTVPITDEEGFPVQMDYYQKGIKKR